MAFYYNSKFTRRERRSEDQIKIDLLVAQRAELIEALEAAEAYIARDMEGGKPEWPLIDIRKTLHKTKSEMVGR